MAIKFKKISVFHFVRCHDDAVGILKKYNLPKGGFVHAFNSNYETAKKYLDLGFMLSIGGPLMREDNRPLHEAVKKIPLERILIESDSPDQAPPSRGENYNEPWTIVEIAAKLSELRGITPTEVISSIKRNNLLSYLNRDL